MFQAFSISMMSSATWTGIVAGAGGCCLLALLLVRRRRSHRLKEASSLLPQADLASLTEGIVVTGAGAGIGAALVRLLVNHCHAGLVVATCRARTSDVVLDSPNEKDDNDEVHCRLPVDLADLASIRRFADNLAELFRCRRVRLSHLVCNAGIFFPSTPTSVDGLPIHAAVNFIANVELIRSLLSNGLLLPGFTRVIFVSSSLSRRGVARDTFGVPVCSDSIAKEASSVAKDSSSVAKEASSAVAKDAKSSISMMQQFTAISSMVAYADSKQCLNLLAQHLHANVGVETLAAFTGGPVATRLLLPKWLPKSVQPLTLWLLSLIIQSPECVAAHLLGLMCRRDVSSGRVYSAGINVAWPCVLPNEKLAEFIAGYERLIDQLRLEA